MGNHGKRYAAAVSAARCVTKPMASRYSWVTAYCDDCRKASGSGSSRSWGFPAARALRGQIRKFVSKSAEAAMPWQFLPGLQQPGSVARSAKTIFHDLCGFLDDPSAFHPGDRDLRPNRPSWLSFHRTSRFSTGRPPEAFVAVAAV